MSGGLIDAGLAGEPGPVAPRADPDSWPVSRDDLARGLLAGAVEVVYQPVVHLPTGDVVAVEALARLRCPRTGRLLAPAAFLPLAEQCGLVAQLDALVARAAVEAGVRWRVQRPGLPFSVAVNVSLAGLDVDLPAQLLAVCEQAGLPANALVVEVTETALPAMPGEVPAPLRALFDAGVNITLDDFGTGYSSLAHLVELPVRGIKVDRAFTAGLGTGAAEGVVAAAVVRLGRELGHHVVAEGVEERAQLESLLALDCPYAQGYLFSRPATETALAALVREGFGPRCERAGR